MKRYFHCLILCFWMSALMAAQAQPTMAGRVKSYDGSKGLLVISLEDQSTRTFQLTDKTECLWMGRKTHPNVIPVGAKISIQISGSLNRLPLKAAKIVDWGASETIVATGAKAPYHTPVGQFASTNGTGGMPEGAPVGNHAPNQTLAAVAHGGAVNAPNPNTHPVNQTVPAHGQSHSSMGQSGAAMYQNQGQSTMAPLEMMNINPMFTPSMGTGSAGSLMGMDSGDYSTGADMMGLNGSAYGGAGGAKITGRVLQANLQMGVIMIQSFQNPQPQRVLLSTGSSAPPNLLVPGQMVEITGQQTAQGFQATDIRAASGF